MEESNEFIYPQDNLGDFITTVVKKRIRDSKRSSKGTSVSSPKSKSSHNSLIESVDYARFILFNEDDISQINKLDSESPVKQSCEKVNEKSIGNSGTSCGKSSDRLSDGIFDESDMENKDTEIEEEQREAEKLKEEFLLKTINGNNLDESSSEIPEFLNDDSYICDSIDEAVDEPSSSDNSPNQYKSLIIVKGDPEQSVIKIPTSELREYLNITPKASKSDHSKMITIRSSKMQLNEGTPKDDLSCDIFDKPEECFSMKNKACYNELKLIQKTNQEQEYPKSAPSNSSFKNPQYFQIKPPNVHPSKSSIIRSLLKKSENTSVKVPTCDPPKLLITNSKTIENYLSTTSVSSSSTDSFIDNGSSSSMTDFQIKSEEKYPTTSASVSPTTIVTRSPTSSDTGSISTYPSTPIDKSRLKINKKLSRQHNKSTLRSIRRSSSRSKRSPINIIQESNTIQCKVKPLIDISNSTINQSIEKEDFSITETTTPQKQTETIATQTLFVSNSVISKPPLVRRSRSTQYPIQPAYDSISDNELLYESGRSIVKHPKCKYATENRRVNRVRSMTPRIKKIAVEPIISTDNSIDSISTIQKNIKMIDYERQILKLKNENEEYQEHLREMNQMLKKKDMTIEKNESIIKRLVSDMRDVCLGKSLTLSKVLEEKETESIDCQTNHMISSINELLLKKDYKANESDHLKDREKLKKYEKQLELGLIREKELIKENDRLKSDSRSKEMELTKRIERTKEERYLTENEVFKEIEQLRETVRMKDSSHMKDVEFLKTMELHKSNERLQEMELIKQRADTNESELMRRITNLEENKILLEEQLVEGATIIETFKPNILNPAFEKNYSTCLLVAKELHKISVSSLLELCEVLKNFNINEVTQFYPTLQLCSDLVIPIDIDDTQISNHFKTLKETAGMLVAFVGNTILDKLSMINELNEQLLDQHRSVELIHVLRNQLNKSNGKNEKLKHFAESSKEKMNIYKRTILKTRKQNEFEKKRIQKLRNLKINNITEVIAKKCLSVYAESHRNEKSNKLKFDNIVLEAIKPPEKPTEQLKWKDNNKVELYLNCEDISNSLGGKSIGSLAIKRNPNQFGEDHFKKLDRIEKIPKKNLKCSSSLSSKRS
ncbi:hypothetical protein SNEBB_002319 [Seison nebaliae]|nr:hypothetical protein SNEBB_002319 [Seison nebaliae]